MLNKIRDLFGKRRPAKLFSAWQVELTTRCPLLCKMCIRSECADWRSQDMSLENFKKILPSLKYVETVVLEGWGESLLHPDLAECVRLVKQQGAQVGFVTSGMGLNRERVAELVEAGQDFVGFSIAGTTPEIHDAIRVHSRLTQVQDAIRLFQEEKKRRNLTTPRIHLIFLMLKDNAHQAASVPAFAQEAGIEEVVITNICHTINRWQDTQRVFVWDQSASPYESALEQAQTNAERLQIRLKRPELSAFSVPVCAEDPLRNLYISAKGEVSPCVYLYPPLPSPFRRVFCNREYSIDKLSFGNLFEEPFVEIWNSGRYREFRSRFIQREREYREMQLARWPNPRPDSGDGTDYSEPPEPCKTCHKIIGI